MTAPPAVIALGDATLRPWQRDDLDALIAHAGDEDVSRYMGPLPFPFQRADGEAFLAAQLARDPASPAWAIEIDGEAAGTISATRGKGVRHRNAELGYWLARKHWGKRLASAAVAAVVPLLFEHLPLLRVSATVFSPNRASARVLEKNGFHLEATRIRTIEKYGELWDELLYVRFAP